MGKNFAAEADAKINAEALCIEILQQHLRQFESYGSFTFIMEAGMVTHVKEDTARKPKDILAARTRVAEFKF